MLSTVEKVMVLRQAALFADSPGDELVGLARVARERRFAPGEELMLEGDVGQAAFLVVEGEVRVLAGTTEVARLGAGQMVGEMAILDSQPRSATVLAVGEVRVLMIQCDDFAGLLSERPELALSIIRLLSKRLRTALKEPLSL